MASLPLGTVIAVTLMVFVTAAVCLPVFFELFLVLADGAIPVLHARPDAPPPPLVPPALLTEVLVPWLPLQRWDGMSARDHGF